MKLKPLLFFLFVPVFSFAQSNYKPGYVIKNSGDTVKGYINYREWDNTPREIEFKPSLTATAPMMFKPEDLKSFSINQLEEYLSYHGLITNDPDRLGELSTGIDTTRKFDEIFLRTVATGPNVTLFTNSDEVRKRFFVKEAGRPAVELIHHEYYTSQTELQHERYYLIQLTALVHKYQGVDERRDERLQLINYTESDLLKAIKVINGSQGVAQATGAGTRFFLSGAANYSKVTIEGQDIFANPSSKAMVSPFVGIGVDFFNNKNVQRFVFRAELSYSYVSGRFDEQTPDYVYQGNTLTYYIKQNNFTVTPQILYNVFNTDTFKWYLDAGVAFNIAVYPENKAVSISGDQYNINNYFPVRNYWFAVPVQTGVLINKRFEVFAAYDFGAAFFDNAAMSIQNRIMRAGIRFHFTKAK